jgi:hypothetical protein
MNEIVAKILELKSRKNNNKLIVYGTYSPQKNKHLDLTRSSKTIHSKEGKSNINPSATHNYSQLQQDIIPPLFLEYDCCLPEESNTELNKIHLDLLIKGVVCHLDHLKLASYRAEDVEKLFIRGRVIDRYIDYYLSFLSYIGIITTS